MPKNINQYQAVKRIGKGSVGEVWLYENKYSNHKVAVKISQNSLESEFKLLSHLNCDFIPDMIYYEQISDNEFYLMEQYIEGVTLSCYKKQRNMMNEKQVVEILLKTCFVLNYLHSQSPAICFNDLKPDNIMVHEHNIYLVDFGSALYINDKEQSRQGTDGYFSNTENLMLSEDIYALGQIACELLFQNKIINQSDFHKLDTPFLSTNIKEIITQCISIDASKRIQNASRLHEKLLSITDDTRKDNRKYTKKTNRYLGDFINVNKTGLSKGVLLIAIIIVTITSSFTIYKNTIRDSLTYENYVEIDSYGRKVMYKH